VQERHYEIVLDATPEAVWEVFWYRGPDKPKPALVTIDILHPGDEIGEGLARHCTFPVPRILGSGGVGQSWEWVTQVKPYESWQYDAVGKPLWSGAGTGAFLELGAATLGESGARRMHPRVKAAWPGARLAAPAAPVRCSPGDNLAIHVAVATAPAGSVIVADMGGARELGYWGEV